MREDNRDQQSHNYQDSCDCGHKTRKYRAARKQITDQVPHDDQKRQIQKPSEQTIRVKEEPAPILRSKGSVHIQQNARVEQHNSSDNGNRQYLDDTVHWLYQDELPKKGMMRQNLFKPENTTEEETKDRATQTTCNQQPAQA
jgi:hypothetical protein